jgi:hypothetical protein
MKSRSVARFRRASSWSDCHLARRSLSRTTSSDGCSGAGSSGGSGSPVTRCQVRATHRYRALLGATDHDGKLCTSVALFPVRRPDAGDHGSGADNHKDGSERRRNVHGVFEASRGPAARSETVSDLAPCTRSAGLHRPAPQGKPQLGRLSAAAVEDVAGRRIVELR